MSEPPADEPYRVLDASALLAWLHEESGAETVEGHLTGSVISAVNLSEVLQKSLAEGVEISDMVDDLEELGVLFAAFGIEEASVAAAMWPVAAPLGLGIADRACLATAVTRGAPALTADRSWLEMRWEGLTVETIR